MNFLVLIGGACAICNYFLGVPKLESIRYLLMIFRPMYKGGCDVKSDICTTTVCVAHSLKCTPVSMNIILLHLFLKAKHIILFYSCGTAFIK